MKKWITLGLLAAFLLMLPACGLDDLRIPIPETEPSLQTQPQPEKTEATAPEKSAYELSLEQDWVRPETAFLYDCIWHSELGYEMKLYYEPGQLYDGYVCFYEPDGSGDYASTYIGNWLYADGILTLVLENYDPEHPGLQGDFPVLADPYGERTMRLFATEAGTELPWFVGKGYDELTVMHYASEDPYTYALSEGWCVPELWELANTGWLSYNGYFLELMEDGAPGDNGGTAVIYNVDANGAYTKSYSGSWSYSDGQLHLCLVPAFGDGYFVDDSFPVLMLDGDLWIGRNEYGIGLPHFYADQLIDILEQPVG